MKLRSSIKSIGSALTAVALMGINSTAKAVDYTDSAVNGKYTGIIYETGSIPVGLISLKVSKKGSFSGRLQSYIGDTTKMKGGFDPDGHYSGIQYNAYGLKSNADMQLEMAVSGHYQIEGKLVSLDGHEQIYTLTRAIYSKTMPTVLQDDYTLLMPSNLTTSDLIPAGNGVGYGEVKIDGKVKFKGYSNAGNKFTYSGVVLDGDQLAFFVKPSNSRAESIIGLLQFQDVPGMSDLNGMVRHSQQSGSSGVPYAAGYDENVDLAGSIYLGPGFVRFPANGYSAAANNAMGFAYGDYFDGLSTIFTWDYRGKMIAPKLPTFKFKGKMKSKVGLFDINYTDKNSDRAYATTKSTMRGIALQKQDLVSGQIITNKGSGRYEIEPNDTGGVAPSVSIHPRKKSVSVEFGLYYIELDIPLGQDWRITAPESLYWVQTTVIPAPADDRPIVIEVQIERNTTGYSRDGKIKIAGLEHKIWQDYRAVDGNRVFIIPEYSSQEPERSDYTIEIITNGGWRVTDVSGAIGDWVHIQRMAGRGNTTIDVLVDAQDPTALTTRSAVFTIGGVKHSLIQAGRDPGN